MRARFLSIGTIFFMCARLLCAFELYMDVDGVDGEAQDANHNNWNIGVSFSTSYTMPTSGPPLRYNIEITKPLDRSSPALALRLCKSQIIPMVVFEFTETAGDKNTFYHLRLHNAVVSTISVNGTANGGLARPAEKLSFSFEEIEWTYIEMDNEGKPSADYYSHWNPEANAGGVSSSTQDADNDGMPDSFEDTHGLDKYKNDAAGDLDGDGLSNYDEYVAGTSPSDPDSDNDGMNDGDEIDMGNNPLDPNDVMSFIIEGNPARAGTPQRHDYGTNYVAVGASITNSVQTPTPITKGVIYTSKGWTGQGDVPATGTTNTVSFTVTTNSVLTWLWEGRSLSIPWLKILLLEEEE